MKVEVLLTFLTVTGNMGEVTLICMAKALIAYTSPAVIPCADAVVWLLVNCEEASTLVMSYPCRAPAVEALIVASAVLLNPP